MMPSGDWRPFKPIGMIPLAKYPRGNTLWGYSDMPCNKEVITKLCRPRVVNCFSRNRLFNILDKDMSLTLVQGPAGSGKTTLASTYIQDRQFPCLWYQLDSGDNDPATFFYYLGRAVSEKNKNVNSKLPPFTPEFVLGAEIFSRRFFEKIGNLFESPTIIVFDNYEIISFDSQLHHLINIGLSHLPVGFKTLFLSRKPLPQAFARHKVSFDMQSISWEDLKLEFEETASIIDLREGSPIPDQVKEEVHRKCEGWAAGVSLLLQAITAKHGNLQLVQPMPEEIFEYFSEEVFNLTDNETKKFLIKTSIITDITAEQAITLSQNKKAKEILLNLLKSVISG